MKVHRLLRNERDNQIKYYLLLCKKPMSSQLTNNYFGARFYWLFSVIIFLLNFTQGYSQKSDSALRMTHGVKDSLIHVIDSGNISLFDSGSLSVPDSMMQKPEHTRSGIRYEKPQLQLPGVKPYLRTNGRLSIDNHFASLQSPYVRSATAYSRLSYSGNIFLAGLPFQTSAFLTTENANVYWSNQFTVRFDAEAYKRQLRSEAEKQSRQLNKALNFNQVLIGQLRSQIERLDHSVTANTFLLDSNYLDRIRIPGKPDFDPDSLKEKLNEYRPEDTLSSKPAEQVNDWQSGAKHRRDSLLHRKDSLVHRLDSLYTRFQEDSSRLAEYRSLLESDPKEILKDSSSSRFSKQLAWISRIKNFQFGQAVVNYNELSLYGLSVKGIDMQMNTNGWITGLTLGRAFNNEGMFDPVSSPVYNRSLAGVQVGRENEQGDAIIGSYFYAADIRSTDPRIKNQVTSLEVRKKYKWLSARVLAASSNHTQSRPILYGEQKPPTLTDKENKALLSRFTLDLDYNAEFSLQWNYVGALFTTIGNPFLRKNYLEKEFTWSQKWLKGKIRSKVFYKKLQTLKSELTPEVNSTQGAGIHVQSAFSKGINFFAVYSPYQMGNNHPDTAFRTLNKTSLLSAGISYSKTWDRVMWFSQLVYSQSTLSGEKLPETNTTQYAFENTWSIDGLHDMRLEVCTNRTKPNLDSMNFSSVNAQYQRLVRQHFSLGGNIKTIRFSETSGLHGVGLNARMRLFKIIQLNASYELDRVSNWWGVEGSRLVNTANLELVYSW